MIRLNLTVEGETEQVFAMQVLAGHLACRGVCLVKPRLTALGRRKGRMHRGGLVRYAPFKSDMLRWLRQDRAGDVFFSTMMDLYGLPLDFPGYAAAASCPDPYTRVLKLEENLQADIGDSRFIAYVQLHEFEALLLSDSAAFASCYSGADRQIASLARLVEQFGSPELVDDNESTAPSKRISREFPDYSSVKATVGPIIGAKIGLDAIRAKCPHFNEWLTKLEKLGSRPQA